MCPTLISSSVFVYDGTHTIIIKVENQQHLLNFAKLILSLQKKGIPFEMSFVYIPRHLKEVSMAMILLIGISFVFGLECFSISSNQNLENLQFKLH